MRNPKDKYYQIPTPIGVISKSQYIQNPKNLVVLVVLVCIGISEGGISEGNRMKEEKIYDIQERVFVFAQRALEIAEMLPQNRVCDVLRIQLVKSGTSIGANMAEADGTVTKRDFIINILSAIINKTKGK